MENIISVNEINLTELKPTDSISIYGGAVSVSVGVLLLGGAAALLVGVAIGLSIVWVVSQM